VSFIWTILLAFLWTAQIAFGWMPCCCCTDTKCTSCPQGVCPDITTLHGIWAVQDACCSLNGVTETYTWDGTSFWVQQAGPLSHICETLPAANPRTYKIQCGGDVVNLTAGIQVTEPWSFLGATTGEYFYSLLPIANNGFGTIIVNMAVTCTPFQIVLTGTLHGTSIVFGDNGPCDGKTWTLTLTP
jgi:hypothetical protein